MKKSSLLGIDSCAPSRLRYKGYESFPRDVYSTNGFGNFFLHLPFTMHGQLGLIDPQGPCIIWWTTALCRLGSSVRKGISARTIES